MEGSESVRKGRHKPALERGGTEEMREKNYFRTEGCYLVGDVTVGDNSNFWYGAVVRGDAAPVAIGQNTNVQDNAVIHGSVGHPVKIGNGVTVGHSAIVHGCTVGDNTLIGMGAIVLDDAVVGNNCIIGAGALVAGGTVVPDNTIWFGNPAKFHRQMKERDIENNRRNAAHYIEMARGVVAHP